MLTRKEISELECFERIMYQRMSEEINHSPHIDWGMNLNAVIISDRCFGRANGIYDYLHQKTNLQGIALFEDFYALEQYIKKTAPDILILVGYQKSRLNYNSIKLAREINPNVLVIMNASVDPFIEGICTAYELLIYSSFDTVGGFVDYIKCNLPI